MHSCVFVRVCVCACFRVTQGTREQHEMEADQSLGAGCEGVGGRETQKDDNMDDNT